MPLLSMLDVLRRNYPGGASTTEAEEFGVGYAIRRALESGNAPSFMRKPVDHFADYPGLVDLYYDDEADTFIPVVGDVG